MAKERKPYTPIATLDQLQKAEQAIKGLSQAEREAIGRIFNSHSSCGYKALAYMIKGTSAYTLKPQDSQLLAYQAESNKDWGKAAEIWAALVDVVPDAKAKADACRAKIAQAAQVVSKASTEQRQSEKQALIDKATSLGINGAKGMAVKTLKSLIAKKTAQLGDLPVEQATPALDEVQAK